MIKAAKKILNMGSKNVLLKGGHLKNKMIFDIWLQKKGIKIFTKRKIRTKNTHGTGLHIIFCSSYMFISKEKYT